MIPLTRNDDEAVHAEVLWVDRFGNAQLNVDPDEIAAFGDVVSLEFDGNTRTGHRAATYADIKTGSIGLVVDSYGMVSISLDRRPASTDLGLGAGTPVVLRQPDR